MLVARVGFEPGSSGGSNNTCWVCGASGGLLFVFRRADRGTIYLPHRMKEDYPLNLSISLSGGEEKNLDTPSNGE